jgi:L-alanine-DL-glutamate epimerase-like enolase superfamily enzyme
MLTRRTFLGSATGGAASALFTGRCRCPAVAAEKHAEARITDLRVVRLREKGSRGKSRSYLEVTSNVGIRGISGELYQDTPRQLDQLKPRLLDVLVGRDPSERDLDSQWLWNSLYPDRRLEAFADGVDPLTGENIWGTRRQRRHTSTGTVMMAISAVDNALWDLRGKLAGVPVYRVLGGKRESLPVYLSQTPSDDPAETRRRARSWFDQGFTAQKWFLRHGPPDGDAGFRTNVGIVEAIRAELGPEAKLMFDFAVGGRGRCDWDVPYAIRVAKAIEPFEPYWLEEPFSPEEIESYARLHGETGIPLATGEHTYSRWNIKPFLDRKLVRFVQSDPEWCGGLSELLQIAALVRQYDGVRLIPHGHHVLAAAHCVASQPESLCPMIEYGVTFTKARQAYQTRVLFPEAGRLEMPTEPGLGPGIDWGRIERV